MPVVVVESPSKATTIKKYLGKSFSVLASYGHVRDLPSRSGCVDPNNDFDMSWEIDAGSKKHLREIENALKEDPHLILATDPDREGEAIAWHIESAISLPSKIKNKLKVERITFHEITKNAILSSVKNPRSIDTNLVNAYIARRSLDYLVGFTISPVLWRKLPGSKSAGRVQSPALRLVVEREIDIEQFEKQEYWTIEGDFFQEESQIISSTLTKINGEKIDKFALKTQKECDDLINYLKTLNFNAASVKRKIVHRKPSPPFITSSLQQEASRKLGFSPSKTMQVAQKLYEGLTVNGNTTGLITYMRTDGVDMAIDAIHDIRSIIQEKFGESFIPDKHNVFKSKQKNAQEAHECIRPTNVYVTPDQLLSAPKDCYQLYELIWKRAVASQMSDAIVERTTLEIEGHDHSSTFSAHGQIIKFYGFLKLYEEDTDHQEESNVQTIPEITEGTRMRCNTLLPAQHFTNPPPRYTEASLVKKMEQIGIGRPSTYASIVNVIQSRGYARSEGRKMYAEDKGILVTAFLKSFFNKYVEYDFTADLEEQLDDVAAGKMTWKRLLKDFWSSFLQNVEMAEQLRIYDVLEKIEVGISPIIFQKDVDSTYMRACPACKDGILSLKNSRFAPFVGCNNYPTCVFTRSLSYRNDHTPYGDGSSINATGDVIIGKDDDGINILLRNGRFGAYLQLGEEDKVSGKKAKRASLPPGTPPDQITLDKAKELLSLPRDLGIHPETGHMITANIGRFGAYIASNGIFVNLKNNSDVFSIGVNAAVTMLSEKIAKTVIKVIGEHPTKKGTISIMKGRFGPYIKWNTVKVALTSEEDIDTFDVEKCVDLIAKKQTSPGSKKTKATKNKKG